MDNEDKNSTLGESDASEKGVKDRIDAAIEHRAPNLDLSGMQLLEFPKEIFQMAWLRSLNMSQNRIGVLPEDIAALENLRVLEIWNNRGISVSDSIGELVELHKLSIGPHCVQLPQSIGRCSQLKELAIGDNNLGVLPDWLQDLRDLEELQLWENEIEELPDWWRNFPRLRVINLSINQISSLPASLGSLSNLEVLDLARNNLSDLPISLAGLTRLRIARLGFNKFESIPSAVTLWRNLQILDINSDTSIEVGVESSGPVRLWQDPRRDPDRKPPTSGYESQLKALHPDMRKLTKLRALLLYGNPRLKLPSELLGGGAVSEYPGGDWDGSVEDILDYYFRTRGGARPLNEAKLILLGWGGVGKTSLVNRLVYQRFNPSEIRTEGIEVTSWPISLRRGEQARLNVWDFGGQEIMHATHQFFLTSRSLYLVVLSGRAGSADADADYWLRIVNSFAPDSPIIIALNQIKRDPFDLDETSLRQKFPNICSIVRTDCATGTNGFGISKLLRAVLAATADLTELRVSFPSAWFEIKDRLAGMSENYLTFEKYREICSDMGELDNYAQEQLADYLHSLGIALNYREDPRLRDTHVLNPHWVTEGIYAILNSRLVASQHGEVAASDLAQILDSDRYPPERHMFLLDLMRRFELCFPYTDGSDKYLIAELLPKQQPEAIGAFSAEGALKFEYRYPVLPEGLLPRFIVRSHIHSTGQPRWRNGALLRWEKNLALVQSDSVNRRVQIAVTGPSEGRRRLLAVIRSDFEHIHSSYRFKVSSFVPVPGYPNMSVEYDKILVAEQSGMRSFPEFAGDRFVEIDVGAVLDGVDLGVAGRRSGSPSEALSRDGRVNIFISYSHKDERYRESLESHLKVLRSAGLVDIWHDRCIDPGEEWKNEIDQALEEADIVVFLVSSDFLASDYCNDVELKRALERHADGSCIAVPIIVRDANWKLSRLAVLQALPTDGKPVTRWSNRDTAWRIVAEGLERLIKSM